jgi:hypothetical protein
MEKSKNTMFSGRLFLVTAALVWMGWPYRYHRGPHILQRQRQ